MRKFIKSDTRKGAASFYVVIFATLVFTVITVSFIRLMISEASQNTDSDLSQSAYDSALMGVEDAKAAVAKCANNPGAAGCNELYLANNTSSDCDRVTHVLYGAGVSAGEGNSAIASADQAYTCVKLKKELEDYKVRFVDGIYTTVVPIDSGVRNVKISWLHRDDPSSKESNFGGGTYYSGDATKFPEASNAVNPPVVSVGVIEEGSDHISNVIMRPSRTGGGNDVTSVYRAAHDNDINGPATIKCNINTGQDYACTAQISTYNNVQYLVISLPYKESDVSFKVEQFNSSWGVVKFTSQVAVDSTGRANDYYRRVESRLQLSDTKFPYPEYALSSSADGDSDVDELSKDFMITRNCWESDNGAVTTCDNAQ